jgi:branched-chain amino acid transport system substrate-binding protein
MKKRLVVILLVFLALIWVTAPVFSQTTKTSKPAGDPIKIGGSLPLTGLASEQAKWVKAGYEAWSDDVNQIGGLLGRPVKLILL